MKNSNTHTIALLTSVALFALLSFDVALALVPNSPVKDVFHHRDQQYQSVITPIYATPIRYAQNAPPRYRTDHRPIYRTKGEVIREVKSRYHAKVLKIVLNEQREVYRVRVLMPSGKVRVVQVNARR